MTTSVSNASGNRIAFKEFEVTGGSLPAAGSALLVKVFERPIQLRNIPDGLHPALGRLTASGFSARFPGQSVIFRPDGASQDVPAEGDVSVRDA